MERPRHSWRIMFGDGEQPSEAELQNYWNPDLEGMSQEIAVVAQIEHQRVVVAAEYRGVVAPA